MDKKTLRNDIILIASLLLVAVISLIFVFSSRQKNVTTAKVYVQNELRLTVDLSKKMALSRSSNQIAHIKTVSIWAMLKPQIDQSSVLIIRHILSSKALLVMTWRSSL